MRQEPWEVMSKCSALSPQQADVLFFPTAGGKPNRANAYCSTCPVMSLCIERAVQSNLEGFWAGTTKDERMSMRPFASPLVQFAMPPEPKVTRRVYRKIVVVEDSHAWLDQDIEPDLFK